MHAQHNHMDQMDEKADKGKINRKYITTISLVTELLPLLAVRHTVSYKKLFSRELKNIPFEIRLK